MPTRDRFKRSWPPGTRRAEPTVLNPTPDLSATRRTGRGDVRALDSEGRHCDGELRESAGHWCGQSRSRRLARDRGVVYRADVLLGPERRSAWVRSWRLMISPHPQRIDLWDPRDGSRLGSGGCVEGAVYDWQEGVTSASGPRALRLSETRRSQSSECGGSSTSSLKISQRLPELGTRRRREAASRLPLPPWLSTPTRWSAVGSSSARIGVLAEPSVPHARRREHRRARLLSADTRELTGPDWERRGDASRSCGHRSKPRMFGVRRDRLRAPVARVGACWVSPSPCRRPSGLATNSRFHEADEVVSGLTHLRADWRPPPRPRTVSRPHPLSILRPTARGALRLPRVVLRAMGSGGPTKIA